jgi:membrane-associated HD superfamily phosphohydrolase
MGVGVPPNKVEAKIRALVKQKLDDGQFDDSGLTLNELKIVEKSVVNSIVAAMHGRIQYPEGAEKHDHLRDPGSQILGSGIQTGVYDLHG